MKKLFLMAAAVLMACAANAQIVASYGSSKASNGYWFVEAGVGLNGIGININDEDFSKDDDVSSKMKIGYDVAFGRAWWLGRNGAHLDLALGLASRGGKANIKYPTDYDYDDKGESHIKEYGTDKPSVTAHQVYFAPSIGWRFKVSNNFAIDPHVGPYVGYDFATSIGGKDNDGDKYDDEDADRYYDWNNLDAGLNAGVAFWYNNKVKLDVRYKASFIGMGEGNYGKVLDGKKTHSVVISLGYAF